MEHTIQTVSVFDRGSYANYSEAKTCGAEYPLTNIDLYSFSASTLLDLLYSLVDCARCFGKADGLMLVLEKRDGTIIEGPAENVIQKINENQGMLL